MISKSSGNKSIYGDDLSEGIAGRGVDIASQRIDDLDRKIMAYITTEKSPGIIDIGSGPGGQALRMVNSGARVTAVDMHDFSKEFAKQIREGGIKPSTLKFIRGDIRNLESLIAGESFDAGYSQRTLHYLRYQDAFNLLKFARRIIKDKLFISVSGLDTELRNSYQGVEVAVHERFHRLADSMAKRHQIFEPVCLYSLEEFKNLLQNAGWKIDEAWLSEFGNVKCVCH